MKVSILIPTYNRIDALIATVTALTAQSFKDFEVIIADQSDIPVGSNGTVQTLVRLLEFHGNPVKILVNFPRRGIAQQRQFLLDRSGSPYSLFLDDDIVLESDALERKIG